MAGQNPINLNYQQAGSSALLPFIGDSATKLTAQAGAPVAGISGTSNAYNITAATVVKAAPGRLIRISVIVAGSAAGTANDCLTTGAAADANEIAAIPNTVGVVCVEWPCATGIVIVPGTGQTVAVSYS